MGIYQFESLKETPYESFWDDIIYEWFLVDCVLVGRQRNDGFLANQYASTMYTHHQKIIVCDATFEKDKNLRRIVAYVGGLDITGGRYDTPEFPLFRTLNTVHAGDFLRYICDRKFATSITYALSE